MLDKIKKELLPFGIKTVSAIPLSMCRITRRYKLEKTNIGSLDSLNVVIFAVPYLTEHGEKNISAYAISRDYHLFFKQLFSSLIPRLNLLFPENVFLGFSDDSPIDERHAAALCGLGILGKNEMLITEEYSSYVFIGEIITDLCINSDLKYEIKQCEECGKCLSACPRAEIGECLSALTQKKGVLSEHARNSIKAFGCAWGCDICQEACPHTEHARKNGTIYTDIPFFNKDNLPVISSDMIRAMNDNDFSERAYSWRKKETILRNLSILEE